MTSSDAETDSKPIIIIIIIMVAYFYVSSGLSRVFVANTVKKTSSRWAAMFGAVKHA